MAEFPPVSFAGLLKQLRTRAGLTQEELAHAASLSVRSVSDLERGVNLTARKQTATLLADALGLTGIEKNRFEAASRGRTTDHIPSYSVFSTRSVVAASRTLPRDISSFTGREPQLTQLLRAVADARESGGIVGIYAIGGMAGIGKTAFAVRAAHRLAGWFPDGQIFLPLHGHTPGQQPVDPAEALASLLQTAGVPASLIPPGLEARARLWRDYLVDKQMLLLFDDAVGHSQIRDLLPGTTGCLVLVTSRQRLVALEDSQVISIDTLPPEDSGLLFARLASRPGVGAADPVVRQITRLCGYLPLAIGMLARQLHHRPAWTVAALASELTSVRLRMMKAENLSVAAAFDLSYQKLTPGQQQTFRRLGIHPGTDIDAFAVAALDETDMFSAHDALRSLYDRYLLSEPADSRFRLHALIREHARSLADTDPADERDAALGRLLDYYAHVARVADGRLASRTPAVSPAVTLMTPTHSPNLDTQDRAIDWMNAERFNLHAAASYAVKCDRVGHAFAISAAMHSFLTSHGHYHQACSLHELALNAARASGDDLAEAGALIDLGDSQHLLGNFTEAIASLNRARDLYGHNCDDRGQAGALTLLGDVLEGLGLFTQAKDSLDQALELYRRNEDHLGESRVLGLMGYLQQATGNYVAAKASFARALELHRRLHNLLREAVTLSYLGQVLYLTGEYSASADTLSQALALHTEQGHRLGQANVFSQFGALYYLTRNCSNAIETLTKALEMHRDLGHPLGEAISLDYLGRVHCLLGDYEAAAANIERALELHHRINNRIGQAEVMNSKGELAAASGRPEEAIELHTEALAIATDIGSPLQEARAYYGIGQSLLQQGKEDASRKQLQLALGIYRSLGSPSADIVAANLAKAGT